MKFFFYILINFIFIMSCMAQNNSEYSLIETSDGASCSNYEVFKNNKKYVLTPDANSSLECPNVIGLHNNWLFYTNQNHQVKQYNLNNHIVKNVFTLYPDIDGVDGPFWSPDHSKIAFTITNLSMNHGYKSSVRIIIFDFAENGKLSNKQKFDIKAYYDCGSRCGSTIDFIDNKTLRYRDVKDKAGDLNIINYQYLKL